MMAISKIDDLKLYWYLDDIIPPDKFNELIKEVEKKIEGLAQIIEKLDPKMSEGEFKMIISIDESLGEDLSRLNYLPYLLETTDRKNQTAQILSSKADQVTIKYKEVSRKMAHWLKGKSVEGLEVLDDNNAIRLFSSIPDLKYQLDFDRKAAKYTLGEAEENIISNKNINGIAAIKDLRSQIETGFEYVLKVKDKKPKTIKTQSELTKLVHSNIAEERKAAYSSLFEKYKENIDKFFIIYRAVARDWNYEAKLRGFKDSISVRNFYNQIPDEAVQLLLETCRENRVVFQKYFKYKAKELGVPQLKRFDIYAPIESRSRKKVELSQAIELILETFKSFSNNFFEAANRIFDEKHIDSHPNPNKRGGAFCATIGPKTTPYIMLNYASEVKDVYTLAHELGHSVHSLLANHHSYSSQHASLPLAETASTLSELLIFEKMYQNEKDVLEKKSMLMNQIANSYASILRQAYFVLFEIKAHEMIEQGSNSEELSNAWLENLKEQFGDSVIVDQIFKYEWSYIPHIVNSPFYCYSYSFGELLSYALYANYKKEGSGYTKIIEEILKSGSSDSPINILTKADLNIMNESFWQSGLETVKNWQVELEKL